ncbi:CENP-B N-terminal DNA-binding domain [Popillia japonica]|uniref:CENP-B N-terminal DNA-binding domain n=1 Tax=Popillia japonica TaxID=7064 RepID=A0AAW1HWW9_POPJA
MSRGRKRKTDKGTFSENSMRQAVEAVLHGGINGRKISLRAAALQYQVKYQTLFRYVKRSRANPDVDIRMTPNYKCRLRTRNVFKGVYDYLLKDVLWKINKRFPRTSIRNGKNKQNQNTKQLGRKKKSRYRLDAGVLETSSTT